MKIAAAIALGVVVWSWGLHTGIRVVRRRIVHHYRAQGLSTEAAVRATRDILRGRGPWPPLDNY